MRHLYTFKGFYYFRSWIPTDLQGLFQCKLIKKALKTNDFKTATSSVKLISNEFDRIIKVIRSGVLNKKQMDEVIKEFFDKHVSTRNEFKLVPQRKASERLEICDAKIKRYIQLLNGEGQDIDIILEGYLSEGRIYVTPDEFSYLKEGFLKALIEATKIEKERLSGNYNNWYDDFHSFVKPVQKVQDAPKKVHLLSEVIQEYTKEKIQKNEWSNAKNRAESLAFYEQLIDIIGDKDIKDYGRDELLDYQGLLIKFPANIRKVKELRDLQLTEVIKLIRNDDLPSVRVISTKTVNKNLIRVNAVFQYAKERGYSLTNPAFDLKVLSDVDKDSEKKDTYTKDDIEKLLSSPIYTEVNTDRPERFWIPLIALFSGLRLGEICQLYKEDIKEEFGIPYFDINKNTTDKSLKNKSSKRLLPISPVLIKIGFMSYVKSVKDARLWTNITKRRDGYGHDFSKWYNRYEAINITDHPKKSFHSLRHTFINQIKQRIVKDRGHGLESVLKETVGHSNESITLDRYGKEYLLQTKLDLIKRLDYGIKFSHLKFKIKKG